MNQFVIIHSQDNLGVALSDLNEGTVLHIQEKELQIKQSISAKHKFALHDFAAGDTLYMYGVVVGKSNQAIQAGELITTENVSHQVETYELHEKQKFLWQAPDVSSWQEQSFLGYHREDGQVGTRNYWLVFPLVFCENRNIEMLRKTFDKAFFPDKEEPYVDYLKALIKSYQNGNLEEINQAKNSLPSSNLALPQASIFENVELRFISHQGGCGGIRQDAEALCRLLAGYVKNPNVAGATVLSLGCQNAEVKIFEAALDALGVNKPVEILEQQKIGKEQDLISQAIHKTFQHLIKANQIERRPAPLNKLVLGLECGGSDGFSGISANPSVGHVSDLIAALGGGVILAEFPELCGVEQELINRMEHPELKQKFTHLMQTYEEAAIQSGSGFDMNPSPGNIKDGLITDAMKSAGAAKKGGNSPILDVLDYTEYLTKKGLNLLCTPGNDVESTTGLVGSGANMVLFTTGLGTPTGNPVSPVVKISSNTSLAQKMPDIIDINTGSVIEGNLSIEEMAEKILDHILKIASGEEVSRAELLEQYDFIPWKRGVSL